MTECQRRLALWCSVGILIFSVVLLSLYFSCMGNCNFQPKSAYAPIWTALLSIALTIFGFVIAFKKQNNTIGAIFASASVVCMICTLVCAYLIIGALIGEKKQKSENDNYMTAMFLWIAMAGATGGIFIFTVIITCGFLCCQCRKKEDVNTAAEDVWMSSEARPQPGDFIRDPPYAPTVEVADQANRSSVIAPTAPPLFMSLTLQRETGMDVTPSPDRRSFCANIVEMSRSETSIEDLVAEMNTYTEMPSFKASNDEETGKPAKSDEVESNINNSASALQVNSNNMNTVEGSIRYSEITDEVITRIDDSHSENVNNNPENQYAEITSTANTDDIIADRERAPDKEDVCEINFDYDYATTQPKLVSLPSIEGEINYVNNSLPRSSNSPISLSNSDISSTL